MGALVDRTALEALMDGSRATVSHAGRLYLLGDTSHVAEGWYPGVTACTFAAGGKPDTRSATRDAVHAAAARLDLPCVWESPEDIVPLPAGHADRHRATRHAWDVPDGTFEVMHFDPYSVICRGLARGDEPDYQTAIRYLERGWATAEGLVELFEQLIPQFTADTIAQDPAEFRRKLKGLQQMWRARHRA